MSGIKRDVFPIDIQPVQYAFNGLLGAQAHRARKTDFAIAENKKSFVFVRYQDAFSRTLTKLYIKLPLSIPAKPHL